MNETALQNGVLTRIDEATSNQIEGIGTRYPIAEFLREAAAEMARTAPVELLPLRDFGTETLTDLGDGSGTVALPEDFVRLASFRMKGWARPVFGTVAERSPEYARQLNAVTRGGPAKPVAALTRDAQGMKLRWFSLPKGWPRKVEEALYVPALEPEEVPQGLCDALCWLAASLVLAVTAEPQAASYARERYDLSMAQAAAATGYAMAAETDGSS